MNLGSFKDAIKAVYSNNSCNDAPNGGSFEVTDLEPNDSVNGGTAVASFNFSVARPYKLCYKVDGRGYVQVGSSLLTIVGVPPNTFTTLGTFSTSTQGVVLILYIGGP